MATWELPTGTGYVPPRLRRASWVSTPDYNAPHKSPSFKQKKWPLRQGPQPPPLHRRRTKNKLADA